MCCISNTFPLKLPKDMTVKWNSRLLKTAGYCAYKRQSTAPGGRTVRIELSVKVCDSAGMISKFMMHALSRMLMCQLPGPGTV